MTIKKIMFFNQANENGFLKVRWGEVTLGLREALKPKYWFFVRLNYTQKDNKYTNTKIQTRTNTNFAIGTLSQIEGGGK